MLRIHIALCLPALFLFPTGSASAQSDYSVPYCNGAAAVSRWQVFTACKSGDTSACTFLDGWRTRNVPANFTYDEYYPKLTNGVNGADALALYERAAAASNSPGLSVQAATPLWNDFSQFTAVMSHWCAEGHQDACQLIARYDSMICQRDYQLQRMGAATKAMEARTNAMTNWGRVTQSNGAYQERMQARNDAGRAAENRDYHLKQGNADNARYYEQKRQEAVDTIKRSEERQAADSRSAAPPPAPSASPARRVSQGTATPPRGVPRYAQSPQAPSFPTPSGLPSSSAPADWPALVQALATVDQMLNFGNCSQAIPVLNNIIAARTGKVDDSFDKEDLARTHRLRGRVLAASGNDRAAETDRAMAEKLEEDCPDVDAIQIAVSVAEHQEDRDLNRQFPNRMVPVQGPFGMAAVRLPSLFALETYKTGAIRCKR